MFDKYLSKLNAHLNFLKEFIESTFPLIYNRIIEECDLIDLSPIFTKIMMTMFIAELQEIYPLITNHIVDVFLCDGECAIFTLITKFITLQHDYMIDIEDTQEFEKYITKQMPKDCLDRFRM